MNRPPRSWSRELNDQHGVETIDAIDALNRADVVIVQHEYGIYDGPDGDSIVEVLESIERPTIVVAHTVLEHPTAHQRSVLEAVVRAADAVVVMTEAGRVRLCSHFDVDARKISVIPHGAAVSSAVRLEDSKERPRLLTWGLLGPGKGIEWAIDAIAMVDDLRPKPIYVVAGKTHPKVHEYEGDVYREMLMQRAKDRKVDVVFDPEYRSLASLAQLISESTMVILPYDSPDQVTSGVLVDAIAAGRPVIATAFPHAVELLSQRRRRRRAASRPGGARRRHPHRAGDAGQGERHGERGPPTGPGIGVARTSPLATPRSAKSCSTIEHHCRRTDDRTARGSTIWSRLTDRFGTFEHAEHATPRREHGYCVDDVARVLVVAAREPNPNASVRSLAQGSLAFVGDAMGPHGECRNRRAADGTWTSESLDRGLLGSKPLGTGYGGGQSAVRDRRTGARALRTRRRTALSVSALDGLRRLGRGGRARASIDQRRPRCRCCVTSPTRCLRARPTRRGRGPSPASTTPTPCLPDAMIAVGVALERPEVVAQRARTPRLALGARDARRTSLGHAGRGIGARRRGSRLRSAAHRGLDDGRRLRASAASGHSPKWLDGIVMANAWFDGDNDAKVMMWDPETGGGFDGLHAAVANQNQGAESTLALVSTRQQAFAHQTIST